MPALSNSRNGGIFTNMEIAEVAIVPGLCYHQIDVSGSDGVIAINVDWGIGERTIKEVDLTQTSRLATIIFGDVKSIRLSPSGVTTAYSANYIAQKV